MKQHHNRPVARTLIAAAAVSCVVCAKPAAANSVEEFYRGKTITLYISTTAATGYDVYGRLLARHMSERIPGKPTIVPRNMPGADGRLAAGYLFNVAPKDGLALAVFSRSAAAAQVIDPKVPYDITKFNWIGNPAGENSTLVTWHTTGVRTVSDAQLKEVTIGAFGDGNASLTPKIMNAILGTKFKVIRGYKGGTEVNLAMESGEVGGRGSNAWGSWKAGRPEWLAENKIHVIVQVGLAKEPDLPDVPLLIDLMKNPDDHALVKLYSALAAALGRPVITTPGVPAERVQALRTAFDATLKDSAFLAEAKKLRLDLNLQLSGIELEKLANEIIATPKPVKDRLVAIDKQQ
jgi:tripartite-type tricarboxylate transporter receptor subunit TctC